MSQEKYTPGNKPQQKTGQGDMARNQREKETVFDDANRAFWDFITLTDKNPSIEEIKKIEKKADSLTPFILWAKNCFSSENKLEDYVAKTGYAPKPPENWDINRAIEDSKNGRGELLTLIQEMALTVKTIPFDTEEKEYRDGFSVIMALAFIRHRIAAIRDMVTEEMEKENPEEVSPEEAQRQEQVLKILKRWEGSNENCLSYLQETWRNMMENYLNARDQRVAEEARKEERNRIALTRLQSKKPEHYTMTNDKVSNNLKRLHDTAGQEQPIKVSDKTLIITTLAYDAANIHTSKKLTSYDREVLNAVCTLYEAGNKEFTPAQVYRVMNGQPSGAKVHAKSMKKVSDSISKLRFTRLTIDYTEQAREWGLIKPGKEERFTKNDQLIAAEGLKMQNHNGDVIEAFRFHTEPILLGYSKQIGQIITIPVKLLDTKKKLHSTEEVTVIRAYLIRRIEGMKGQNTLTNRCVNYDNLMKEVGIDLQGRATPRKKKLELRKNVASILDHLTEQSYIAGYSEYKEGRTFKGVTIDLQTTCKIRKKQPRQSGNITPAKWEHNPGKVGT